MKLVKFTVREVADKLLNLAQSGEEFAMVNIADTPGIIYGNKQLADLSYAKEHDITTLYVNYGTGAIAFNAGDLNLVIYVKGYQPIDKQLAELLTQYLAEHRIACEIDNNDILIGGKKIGATASIWIGDDGTLHFLHVSQTVDMNFIRETSRKAIVKVPAGLSDFADVDIRELTRYLLQRIEFTRDITDEL